MKYTCNLKTLCFGLLCLPQTVWGDVKPIQMTNRFYKVQLGADGVSSFCAQSDTVNLIANRKVWGNVIIRYRINKEDWNNLETGFTRRSRVDDKTVVFTDSLIDMPLCMKRYYKLETDGLHLKVEITNVGKRTVELGDVAFPVEWQQHGEGHEPTDIFEKGFVQKHNIALNSSFLTFSKPSGKGPFYMMLTENDTPLEFFKYEQNVYTAYVHSGCTGPKTEGNWRMPHTSYMLPPEGSGHNKVSFSFKLVTVDRYENLRQTLYDNDLLDIHAAPGYTVPRNLSVDVALRLKGKIDSLSAEYPARTEIKLKQKNKNGRSVYTIQFNRLGENKLIVHYNDSCRSVLEFFSTEPLETLIKKRSRFVVEKQQHKVPGKWWDGLYSVYDMKYGKLRGPEDTDGFDGWWGYVLSCDDPALGKAPFVAAKNAVYPDSAEIASLEYYVKNFVWGKLQRTDKEQPYPYAIYGVPNWYIARDPKLHAMCNYVYNDRIKIWRAYDYPHIIKLYYALYKIAEQTPQFIHYLTSEEYLNRAVETAKAFYKYPYEILPWMEVYKWGMYNELVILDIINELEQKGRREDAAFLRGEWEKKAKYFIYDDKYPYRSEYSFDRTAFESSYAFAKYGVEHPMKPDKNLWFDKNKKIWYSHPKVSTMDALRFMNQQHYAGLTVRGWLAPKYYLAGADCADSRHLGDQSYMSMMGGWSVLDYGLLYSQNTDWIELGYNSYLSSWSLMNTGDKDSDYGYWYPGKEKDGASAWSMVSAKSGTTWIRKFEHRGGWRYDGEIDLGYGAAFHTARTVLVQDSIFGLHVYGGTLQQQGRNLYIIPQDGVRQQFSCVLPEYRLHLSLNRDGFKKDVPIKIATGKKQLQFTLENRIPAGYTLTHKTILAIRTQSIQPEKVTIGGRVIPFRKTTTGWEIELPVKALSEQIQLNWR